MRLSPADALAAAFPHVSDKYNAWQDLIYLAQGEDHDVRLRAVDALGLAFPHVPDKDAAWKHLIQLTCDENNGVRLSAVDALGLAFPHVPDKYTVWQDLIHLTQDEDHDVRLRAADALVLVLYQVPDQVPEKESAWQELIDLTSDEDSSVRLVALRALGKAFYLHPNKDSAWQDLIHLTRDENRDVRVSANYSLGRASIFKATETKKEEDFRRELENALGYFERSVAEALYSNPANFCFPFYRSFYVLAFKGDSYEAEIARYLADAKMASEGSKSKVELLEAVENLATALREVQRLHYNLDDVQSDLKVYMQYCNRAAELLDNTEELAPGATKLVRMGLPIIGQRIKGAIAEIQEKSKAICQLTHGTDTPLVDTSFEPLGVELNSQAIRLSDSDYLKSARSCLRMSKIVKDFCELLSPDKKGLACETIEEISENNELLYNLSKLETALIYIKHGIEMEAYERKTIQKMDEANKKLDSIIYSISRIKIRSADAADSLRALKWELDQVKAIKSDVEGLDRKVEDLDVSQQQVLQELKAEMPRIIEDLETLARGRDDEVSQEILKKLENLKRSPGEMVFDRASGLASIVGLLLTLAL